MSDQFAAFRHSPYRRYFVARFLTTLGFHLLTAAVAWQLYVETGNPIWLGLIGVVQFLPAFFLVLVTGITSDRVGRRLVMGCAVSLMAACGIAFFTLAAIGNFNPILVLVVLTVFGVARAFNAPASASLVVNLVPTEDFPNAVGWVSSSWQLASLFGPALAGLLYSVSNLLAYGSAVVMCLGSALLIFSIPKPAQRVSKDPTTLKTLLGGFTYIWKQKVVLGAISLDLFAVFLGGVVALVPVYAHDILDMGASGYGLLRAAPGIGAIAVVLYLTRFPIRDHAGIILFACVGLFGGATAVFGYSTTAWLSILALVGIGAFDMVSVYIREILLQLWTPDDVRGRVNAVNSIFITASNELGEARAGFMAAKWGAVLTVATGAFAAMGVAALWSVLFPEIRKVRYLDKDVDDAAELSGDASD